MQNKFLLEKRCKRNRQQKISGNIPLKPKSVTVRLAANKAQKQKISNEPNKCSENFADFADNWYELTIKSSNISTPTKNDYRYLLYTNIIPYFKDFLLSEITEDDCQRFINGYSGYSKALVSKLRMTLKRVLRKAAKQGLIAINPAEDIVLPKVVEGHRRPLTDDERAALLRTAETHFAGPMVLTMLYCGLRPAEIKQMKWDWIDFENSVLTVGKSKTTAGTGRKLPIPTRLRKALLKQKLCGYNKEYVFVRPQNYDLPLDGNAFYRIWHNFCRRMDIENGAEVYRNRIVCSTIAPDFEPYLLRHTFCTDCQAAGVPINVAKELMGHSDISITARIYTHMVDEVFEQNRERLEQYDKYKNATA